MKLGRLQNIDAVNCIHHAQTICLSSRTQDSHLKLGRNDDKKLTIPQNVLACFNVFGDSRFLIAAHLSFNGV